LSGLTVIFKSALDARPNISFAFAYEALLLLADRQQQIGTDISLSLAEFRSWLQPILDLVVEVWAKSGDKPLLFATFSIPPPTKPSSVIIHNWAFASIGFAQSMKSDA
jgi:hypothetical protein